MKEELQDEILATEIAKQPGLLHQILADRVAQMNQATGGGMTGAGMGGINGQPPPMQTEESAMEGGIPPARGVASPVTAKGAIAGAAARRGGVAVAPKK